MRTSAPWLREGPNNPFCPRWVPSFCVQTDLLSPRPAGSARFFLSPPLAALADSADPSPASDLPSLARDLGVVEDLIWVSGLEGAALTRPIKRRPNVPPLSQIFHLSLKKRLFGASSGQSENGSNEASFCFILGNGV